MDSIRKKMQTMKFDIDALYVKNSEYESKVNESNKKSDQYDIQIRDTGKKVNKMETALEEIMEKIMASTVRMEEAEKEYKDKEEETRISTEKLANTVLKLALMSKDADNIIKGSRHWESKTMNNEMEIETLDNNLKEARIFASDNEMKSD